MDDLNKLTEQEIQTNIIKHYIEKSMKSILSRSNTKESILSRSNTKETRENVLNEIEDTLKNLVKENILKETEVKIVKEDEDMEAVRDILEEPNDTVTIEAKLTFLSPVKIMRMEFSVDEKV